MSEPRPETVIIGNAEVTHQLTQQRALRVTTYLYAGDTPEAVNQRLDQIMDMIDRQFVRADVINKEAQVAATMAGIEDHREQIDDLIKKRDAGNKKLTSVQMQSIAQWDDRLRGTKNVLASLQRAIAEGKRKLNGSAPSA